MVIPHILEAAQFENRELLDSIFSLADELRENHNRFGESLHRKTLANIFYEASTRTRLSFEQAMYHLGGKVIGTEAASKFSSATKGETLEDTIRVIGGYGVGAIVLRHPDKGSAKAAASVSRVPIINAGDGDGEHPTQALLDLYTIKRELGSIDSLKIAMVGDLKYGRTVHSLTSLLAMHSRNSRLYFISPDQIRMPIAILKSLRDKIDCEELPNFEDVLDKIDIFYVTRVQRERFRSEEDYLEVKDAFVINRGVVAKMKKEARIMHPLPRVTEVSTGIDDDERAAYFRQAENGLYVRMALLRILLDDDIKGNFYKYFNTK